jgi:hypothetical protein
MTALKAKQKIRCTEGTTVGPKWRTTPQKPVILQ